jgi:hypothetical protein
MIKLGIKKVNLQKRKEKKRKKKILWVTITTHNKLCLSSMLHFHHFSNSSFILHCLACSWFKYRFMTYQVLILQNQTIIVKWKTKGPNKKKECKWFFLKGSNKKRIQMKKKTWWYGSTLWYDPSKVKFRFWRKKRNNPGLRQQS